MVDFPLVPLATIAKGLWKRPRARVKGLVAQVVHEQDGDVHIRLTDGANFIVCEVIPELPMPSPHVGATVTLHGIVRYDGEHRWWELHPLL